MTTTLAVLFALLTAFANAAAVTTQHVASTGHDAPRRGWHLLRYLLRRPLWLLGWVGMAASLVFQAFALHFGPLALVQPLLVSELVLALVLRRWWLRQTLRAAAWASAGVTTVALAVFLVDSAPRGPTWSPGAAAWTAPSAVVAALVLACVYLARSGTPSRRAGAYATATALLWALEATFIKASADVLVSRGLLSLLASWPLYALITCGVAGLITEQAALHVGPLKISQPVIVIVDPLASIVLGVTLYHERLANSSGAITIASLAFVALALGVVVMTRTVPATTSDVRHL